MSEPKRWTVQWDESGDCECSQEEHVEGDFVYYSEYARLKAEVERLTKAGDEILNGWQSNSGSDVERFTKACWLWITAKEGKPSEKKSPSFIENLGNGVEKHDSLFRVPPAKEGKPSV